MTKITILKTDGIYHQITVEGHAGYSEEGNDIVCAGISVLTINLVNSLETLSEDAFCVKEEEETGLIDIRLSYEDDEEPSFEAEILIESFIIGMTNLSENYSDYLSLEIKEV